MDRVDYMNPQGAMRNISAAFLSKRAKTIDQVYLETNRLEKRLEKVNGLHWSELQETHAFVMYPSWQGCTSIWISGKG
jgi:hypothetical protein